VFGLGYSKELKQQPQVECEKTTNPICLQVCDIRNDFLELTSISERYPKVSITFQVSENGKNDIGLEFICHIDNYINWFNADKIFSQI